MPVIRYDVFNGKRNTYLPGSVGKQQDFLVGFLYMPIPRLKAQASTSSSRTRPATPPGIPCCPTWGAC